MKQRHKQLYMDIARTVSTASYAVRRKVGAVAVRDHRILAASYNGTPPGADNACEEEVNGELVTKRDVIHAEMNAIFKMTRDGESGKGADLFVTLAPCFACANAILAVGIRKVYFGEAYRDMSGVEFLKEQGVEVEQF